MPQTVTEFDRLWYSAVDATLDGEFAKGFEYRRGKQALSITASLGSYPIEIDEAAGVFESWHGHRFMVTAADLDFGDGQSLPLAGDLIVEPTPDGRQNVYEVMKTPKTRCYEPIDAQRVKFWVYAKLVRTEPA